MVVVDMNTEQNFEKFWLNLSEKQRKTRTEQAFRKYKKVADIQLDLLTKYKKSKEIPKSERHIYFFAIVKSFWKDAEFALALGKKKYRDYAIYPVRTMMEKLLKIIWFTRDKTIRDQNEITIKELLLTAFDNYNFERNDGGSGDDFKRHYNAINACGDYPDIDSASRSRLKAFPTYKELCERSGLVDAEHLYASYSYLSTIPHGELLSVINMQEKGSVGKEYRRVMMLLVRFAQEMLLVTDFHLKSRTKEQVNNSIKEVKQIVKAGMHEEKN